MAKHSHARPGHLEVVPTPIDEAIARLSVAYGALLGFELMLEQIHDLGRDLNGQVLAGLIHPHILELDAVRDELQSSKEAG